MKYTPEELIDYIYETGQGHKMTLLLGNNNRGFAFREINAKLIEESGKYFLETTLGGEKITFVLPEEKGREAAEATDPSYYLVTFDNRKHTYPFFVGAEDWRKGTPERIKADKEQIWTLFLSTYGIDTRGKLKSALKEGEEIFRRKQAGIRWLNSHTKQ